MRIRDCPCGSGLERTDCDPAELAVCMVDDCPELFHRHAPSHRYCTTHARERRRDANRRSAAKRRAGRPLKRELAAIATAEARRQRATPLPEQTTLEGTL